MAVRPIRATSAFGLTSKPSRVEGEGASETFKQGAPLVNGASADEGYLIEASSDPSSGVVIGFADEDAENNAVAGAKKVRFTPALAGVIFEGTLMASADVSVALAATDKFKKYGLAKNTGTGFWVIDQSETSSTVVYIIGFRDDVGTSDARVYFVVEADKVAWA